MSIQHVETVDWRKVAKSLKATCMEIAKNCRDGGPYKWADKEPVIDVLHAIAAAIEHGLPRESDVVKIRRRVKP